MLRTRVRMRPVTGVWVSLVFALAFAALSHIELVIAAWTPRWSEPTPVTLRVPGTPSAIEGFRMDRVIVPRGTVLDPNQPSHRAAMHWDMARRPPSPLRLGSAFILYLFGTTILTNYFQRYGHSLLRLLRAQLGLFGLVTVMLLLAKAALLFTALRAFWIPVSAVALLAALGFDRRTALLLDVAISFMVASLLRFDLLLLTVFLTRGIAATLLFRNKKQRWQMISAGLMAGAVAVLAYLSLRTLQEGAVPLAEQLSFDSDVFACFAGGAISGLLAALFHEPAQLLMGHVSRARLLDLTDIEAPLLRKMATEAPGSWEHSRAMANLAEAAAAAIGADALLTRVGAYYHDLGKTVDCRYFIENLGPGEKSPHDGLAPEASAEVIVTHVVKGTKILRDGGVPEPVVEFAYTHHGTQLVEYFWNKYRDGREARRAAGEEVPELDESHFRYPGMAPMTKETAILMLVDAIEAASRTIQPPDHEKFQEMIRRVVFTKLSAGQLDDSGLTLSDLRIMTERMAATLVNMYHGRIKYPWQVKKEQEEAQAAIDKARAASAGKTDEEEEER